MRLSRCWVCRPWVRGWLVAAAVAAPGVAPEAAGDRPSLVDHSRSIHFPPIKQQTAGDCTCYSSTYYYNTFKQARDEGLDARAIGGTGLGDPDVIGSPRFTFLIIAEGGWGALGTRTAMERLADSGSSSVTEFAYEEDVWGPWPPEAAWVQALRNRTYALQSIRVDSWDGLEAARQVIASGTCLVTRGDFGANYGNYLDYAAGYGINNRVMYDRDMSGHGLIHSFCIVGYDDGKDYYDHRDRRTHYGAFLVANSEGPTKGCCNSTGTGSKGFMWIAYTMFLERQLGYYNWPWVEPPEWDPCFDNEPDPTVYYHLDRPRYRPRLFAVVGLNHGWRNRIVLQGGIDSTNAPDFWSPEAIKETDKGRIPIRDSRRVAVDLTDGVDRLTPGVPTRAFVTLRVLADAQANGTITSADFHYDPDGDGVCEVIPSKEPTVTVAPGSAGSAGVQITAPVTLYVDDDAADNPFQDGTIHHPYGTIQAAIEAATGPAVVRVRPGRYVENNLLPKSSMTIVGSGVTTTTVASPSAGAAVRFLNVTNSVISDLTFDNNPGGVQIQADNSTVTVLDCVLTGARDGVDADHDGRVTLRNCLIVRHTGHGVWADGATDLHVLNCTIADNAIAGIALYRDNPLAVSDSILWNNGDDLILSGGSTVAADHCDIRDGDSSGLNGNFASDPRFVAGRQHDYCLSHSTAGQGVDSPCVDAGGSHAVRHDFHFKTTRTDEANDSASVDLGYHASHALEITSIQVTRPQVQIRWSARPGGRYVVGRSDDLAVWDELPVGETDTWIDPDAASDARRFYRVREP